MKIEHIAIWVKDLEKSKDFYIRYFGAKANTKYHNPKKNFSSYFLSFDGGCRIELMHHPLNQQASTEQSFGLAHFAITLGSKTAVDHLTQQLEQDGLEVVGAPRTTGDGYYESVVRDPEGNRIELTI